MILIEKEFLSFGHQFALRNGISQKDNHNEDQRSPIFLQWLDIIHQLIFQFPEAFEFNMELLLFLAFHYNSCLYGNFMYNCENERLEKKAKVKTCSIWTDVNKNYKSFLNSNYNPQEFIVPDTSPYKMRFWEELFFRWNPSIEKKYPYGRLFLNGNGSGSNNTTTNNTLKQNSNNLIINSNIGVGIEVENENNSNKDFEKIDLDTNDALEKNEEIKK